MGALGSAPLTYKWLFNGGPVGANSPALLLSNIQPSQAGSYSVRLTNAFGAVTSAPASITVNFAINTAANGAGAVSRAPNLASYAPGSTVLITASPATNANFTDWSGDATGTDNPLSVTLASNITVVANFNTLQVVPDIILDNTNSQVSFYGTWQTGTGSGKYGPDYRYATGSLQGSSNALFVPNLPVDGKYDVFIWYKEGSDRATNAPWTIYWAGGTDTCYVNQQTNGAQWFRIAAARDFLAGTSGYVRLSNLIGVTNKVVMADAVRFTYVAPPFITGGPQSQTVVAGQPASFSVAATGCDPLSYQWRKNKIALPAASGSALQLSCPRYADAGFYSVVVSNLLGSVASGDGALAVMPPQIQSLTHLANGLQEFQVNWATSNTVVEACSDFANWQEIVPLQWNSHWLQVQDPATNAPHRFYRTKLLLPDN